MKTKTNLYKRVKRLEIAVCILGALLILTSSAAIYSAMQIRNVANKIPSYQDIKNDITALKVGVQTLDRAYHLSDEKIPKAYEYTKEKTKKGYEYTKEKTSELMKYIKDKTK